MKRPGFILILFIIVTILSYGHTPYTGSPTGSSWGYKSNTCNPTTIVTLKNQITSIYQSSGNWYAVFRVRKSDDSAFSSSGTAELWDETTSSMINSTGYPAGTGSIDIGGNISYIQSGTHQFVVKVIPSSGCTNSLWTDKYYITYSNSPPSEPSPLQEPRSGYVGVSLTYIYQVTDPDGDDVNLHVVWGDGTSTWESGLVSSGTTLYPSHTYNSVGTYTISTRGFDEHGIEGPLRVFNVNISASPPTVSVLGPNGGESWQMGTNHDIRWTCAAGSGASLDHIGIELYRSGTRVRTIAGSGSYLPGSQRVYSWNIPTDLTPASDYKMKVIVWDNYGQSAGDYSDGNFTITAPPLPPPPTVSVLGPNGGESWQMGTNHDIRWTCAAGSGASLDHIGIELYRSGTRVRTIAGSGSYLPGSQRVYSWDIPTDLTASSDYKMKVIVWDDYGQSTGDYSDSTFEITGIPSTDDNLISGRIFETHTTGLSGVSVRIEGGPTNLDTTITNNSDGTYTFGLENGLEAGTYTITPSRAGYTFYPASRTVNIASEDVTGVNFYIDNEVPVVTLTAPASGASVSGNIFFYGAAYTEVTVGPYAGIDTITFFVDGEQKAWAYLPVSDYIYHLEELIWHDVNGMVLNDWDEVLPASGMADVQVVAVGHGGKVGYSPHIFLTLGGGLNVTITSSELDNMPLLRDSEVTAFASVTGGSGPYTYEWFLDGSNICTPGCSDSVTFEVSIFSKFLNLVVEDSVGNIGTERVQIFVDTPSVSGNPEALRQASAGYGINVANGNFFMQRTDLTLPAVGLPIVFTRTYNSCRFFASHDGPLGRGWTHSYDIRLKASQYSPDVQITWGDGMEDTWLWMWMYGAYRSASMENFNKLEKSGNDFILTDKNQTRYYFIPETTGSENYLLSYIEDRKGNHISLTYDTENRLTEIRNNTSNRFITLAYSASKIISLTDNAGRTVSYSYYDNRLKDATDLRGKTEEYQYVKKDDLGAIRGIYLLSAIIDKKQNTVLTNTYNYVSGDLVQTRYRCTSQTHGADQTYSFNYANDSETVVTNPLNQETHFSIDSAARVTDITNTINNQVYRFSVGYDYSGSDFQSKGLPTKTIAPQQNGVSNPAGTVMAYSTDGQGNLLNLCEPNPIGDGTANGPNHRFEYITDTTANKNLIKTYIDPDNKQYDFSYYDNDLLQTVTFPDSGLNASVTYTYNADNQVSTVTTTRDGNIQTVQYLYENDYKDLTKVITPLGHSTNIMCDEAGRVTSVTDALGKVTIYTYNGDLLETIKIPIDSGRTATTTYTYDDNGRLIDILDPMGKHTVYEYDTIGRLIKETNAAGNVLRYEYDKLNRLYRKTFTNSALHLIQYDYDDAGYLQGIQNVDLVETVVTYTYDKNGNVKTETDGLNRTKTYTYDNMDRLTRIDYDDGTYETFVYNSRSLVEHYTDRRGNITDYIYDSLGRLKMVYEPVEPGRKVTTEINYDTVGNIKEIIAPANRLIRFEYDNDNRLTKCIEDPNGAALDFIYTYYNNNRLHTYTADGLTATYDYYDSGWLKSIAYTGGTTIQLTYNDNGFLTGMTDGAGNTVYGRDEVGRMLSRTDPFGNTVGYHYDSIGRLDVLTYPGNKSVSYTYDAAHRMKTVTSWLGTMATYNYNAAGQLSGILNGNNASTTYGYQTSTGRLTGITHKKSDNTVIASYQFTLDGNGNRITSSEIQPLLPQLQPQNISYTYDGANRLQTAGDKTFNFNDRGVLAGITSPQGNYSFTFDILDRLTSLTGPGNLSASFVHDGQGNRLSQTVNGEVTRFVVDTNKALPDVLMEVNTANTPQSYYIYGLGLIARLESTGSNPKYYHFDGTGSTVALTDSTQAVTDAYAYDPFGNVTDQFGTTPNPFKYVGQFGVQTAPAGLQYMRARYYMPEIGRFLSRDKIWGTAAKSQSLNLFAYTQSNPINLIDPDGLFIISGLINGINMVVETTKKVLKEIKNAFHLPAKSEGLDVKGIYYGVKASTYAGKKRLIKLESAPDPNEILYEDEYYKITRENYNKAQKKFSQSFGQRFDNMVKNKIENIYSKKFGIGLGFKKALSKSIGVPFLGFLIGPLVSGCDEREPNCIAITTAFGGKTSQEIESERRATQQRNAREFRVMFETFTTVECPTNLNVRGAAACFFWQRSFFEKYFPDSGKYKIKQNF